MNFHSSICSCSVSLLCGLGAFQSVQAEERPNILVILIDDAGYADFGFMGSTEMETPHIDALRREGVLLTDAHVAATVSSPSRACLITGRYGHRFGYECNPQDENFGLPLTEQTLGDVFKENGYRTAAIGKWHLGSQDQFHPNRRGFDWFYGMKSGGRSYYYDEKGSDRPGNPDNLLLNDHQVKFDKYLTDEFTDKAVAYIQESDQPFMLYLSYNAVHTPMQAPQEDLKRFAGHPRQKLAAMTYALDRGVGQVVKALKESGKFDNTLIFFLSDNGGATINQSLNTPLKGFKGNKFEGGHRVPFFVVWKNGIHSKSDTFDGLSSSLDIFTTAMEAAGITKSKNTLDGVSLLPYLNGKKGNPHDMLFWRKMDTRAVRYGDYKLIITQGVDSVLYNLKSSLDEEENLIAKKPKLYRKMARKLIEWEKSCVAPIWDEQGWGKITNGIHQSLMQNQIRTREDLQRKRKK